MDTDIITIFESFSQSRLDVPEHYSDFKDDRILEASLDQLASTADHYIAEMDGRAAEEEAEDEEEFEEEATVEEEEGDGGDIEAEGDEFFIVTSPGKH